MRRQNLFFWKNKKKYFNMPSAETISQSAKHYDDCFHNTGFLHTFSFYEALKRLAFKCR